jgi:hypothetical protein
MACNGTTCGGEYEDTGLLPPSSGRQNLFVMFVNLYQTSWHYNPEDSHLQIVTLIVCNNWQYF